MLPPSSVLTLTIAGCDDVEAVAGVGGVSGDKEFDGRVDVVIVGAVFVLERSDGSLIYCAALLPGLRGEEDEEISVTGRLCDDKESPEEVERVEEGTEEEVVVDGLMNGLTWPEEYFS